MKYYHAIQHPCGGQPCTVKRFESLCDRGAWCARLGEMATREAQGCRQPITLATLLRLGIDPASASLVTYLVTYVYGETREPDAGSRTC